MDQPTNEPQDATVRAATAAGGQVQVNGKTQVLGLDYKTAAILCYVPICMVNLISDLIFLKTEPKENYFLRFHAMQSLTMCLAYVVLNIAILILSAILAAIPLLGWMLAGGLHLIGFAAFCVFIWKSVVGIVEANKGNLYKIEIVGDIAEKKLQGRL